MWHCTNSNLLNFFFFFLKISDFFFWTRNDHFGANLVQKIKIVCLRLNLVSRLIQIHVFFISNQVAKESDVKNGLKIKQLTKQPPTLKTLLQNVFSWTLSKKFYFFNFKFTEAKFLYNCFWYNLIVYNKI